MCAYNDHSVSFISIFSPFFTFFIIEHMRQYALISHMLVQRDTIDAMCSNIKKSENGEKNQSICIDFAHACTRRHKKVILFL